MPRHSFCIFIFLFQYIHSYNHSFITFAEVIYICSKLQAQWAEPPWSAETRLELGPSLQQASSLPSEPPRTLLSYAAPYWPTLHPVWATLRPIWATLHPTELQTSKENIQHKKWKWLTFFSTFVGNFCLPEYGSGLRIRIRIQRPHWIPYWSDPDPYPQH